MRDSTRKVRDTAYNISFNYFNNKKRWASIEKGEKVFVNRANQFTNMANDLHLIAETPRAHEIIENLKTAIYKDVMATRNKFFQRGE